MFPFSFREYLLYYPENDIQAAFDRYVIEGGMSGSYLYKIKQTQGNTLRASSARPSRRHRHQVQNRKRRPSEHDRRLFDGQYRQQDVYPQDRKHAHLQHL